MSISPDKPRRRWLRFNLRSLFLLVFVIAASLGWALYKARQQGIAVAALREMGYAPTYENVDGLSQFVLQALRSLLTEDESRTATSLGSFESQVRITDAGLRHVSVLNQLQYLNLDGEPVTDAGLVHLEGLTQLWYLILRGTQVTDAGLVHLDGLTQLKELNLAGTQVTGAGVQRLQKALPNCNIVLTNH